MKYPFLSLYFQSVFIFHSEIRPLGYSVCRGLVVLPIQLCVFWLQHLRHFHLHWLLIHAYLLPIYFLTIFLFLPLPVSLPLLLLSSFSSSSKQAPFFLYLLHYWFVGNKTLLAFFFFLGSSLFPLKFLSDSLVGKSSLGCRSLFFITLNISNQSLLKCSCWDITWQLNGTTLVGT